MFCFCPKGRKGNKGTVVSHGTMTSPILHQMCSWAGIDRDHRKCNLCDKRDIGDEFHYLLSCSFFANTRRGLLPSCYLQHPNCIVFKNVLNWNWRTHANLSLSYWSNFQVHSATNHVFVNIFLVFLISIHWWFTIMYYFYVYSKYVFMSLNDIPVYLVLYTFGTYFVFCICLYGCLLVFLLFLYTNPPSLVFW